MGAHRVNVRATIVRIADDYGLDLRTPSGVQTASSTLCAGLRGRVSRAELAGIAAAAKRSPAAQAAQACRLRQQRKVSA
jgi:hypothetical protein